MPLSLLLAALATIFASHFIGAITAYGSTLLALPVLAWLLGDLPLAVLVLLAVGTVQSFQILVYTWRETDWPELRRIVLWAGAALPLGFFADRWLPETALMTALGVVVLLAGGSRLGRGVALGPRRPPDWLLNALLAVGGLIHGAFASGGATLVVVCQYRLPGKDAFRATLTTTWCVLNAVLLGAALARGRLTGPAAGLIGLALPLVIAGGWWGERLARRLPQARFTKLVAILLVFAGVITLAREVRGLWE